MSQKNILVLGILLSVAATSSMDATGFGAFSALPLLPLAIIFLLFGKISTREAGFNWGKSKDYALAIGYPLIVAVSITLIFGIANSFSFQKDIQLNIVTKICKMFLAGSIVVLLTEEFFFRGYVYSGMKKNNITTRKAVLFSALIFAVWHISAVTLISFFKLPIWQIPIFLANAFLLGVNWCLLRVRSNSIIVPALSHSLWNGLVYTFFGFGEQNKGILHIQQSVIFGPEIGVLGILFNGIVSAILLKKTELN